MNRWNIPDWLERKIIERDQRCVYCGILISPDNQTRGTKPSWEHIVNDMRIVTFANIARCCVSCNASKGQKPLPVWLDSIYCRKRHISRESVALVVRNALECPPSLNAQTDSSGKCAQDTSRESY